jgi:hypothetical protein
MAQENGIPTNPAREVPAGLRRFLHQLRGPLTALEVAGEDLSGLPAGRRQLVEAATKRFRDLVETYEAQLRDGTRDVPR